MAPALALAFALGGCASDGDGDSCAEVTCDEGEVCDPIVGECISAVKSCTVSADCSESTKKCLDDVCVPKCHNVVCDPEFGEICDPEIGECVASLRCEDTSQCTRENTFCEDGDVGGKCVGNRFATCSASEPCSQNLDCISNGFGGTCAAPCDATPDCSAIDTCNLDPDAGPQMNHCQLNLCRPGTDGMADGFQDANYMGPCNVMGAGDGTCLGPLQLGLAQGGFCLASGQAQPGEACSTEAGIGHPQACDNGFCAADDGVTEGVCLELCSLFDAASCTATAAGPQACAPLFGTNGFCVPQANPPAAAGAPCTQIEGGPLACIEGFQCVPALSGNGTECRAGCDLNAQPAAPGSCAVGACIMIDPNNTNVGVCNAI